MTKEEVEKKVQEEFYCEKNNIELQQQFSNFSYDEDFLHFPHIFLSFPSLTTPSSAVLIVCRLLPWN